MKSKDCERCIYGYFAEGIWLCQGFNNPSECMEYELDEYYTEELKGKIIIKDKKDIKK